MTDKQSIIKLSAGDFKNILDIALDAVPGSYISTSFRCSISNYWVESVCDNLSKAQDASGNKYQLSPDSETFKSDLSKLYF